MWCVVHVRDKEENNMEDFVAGLLSGSVGARCFHLTRSRQKKFQGRWQTIQEDLFPGYVFIDTERPEEVYRELKKTPKPNLLFSDDEYVATLEKQEADFMGMIADKNGDVGLSKIKILENGNVRYLSGPLTHVQNRVKKVNLHKRIAEIEADFLGCRQILYLGIEIEDMRG